MTKANFDEICKLQTIHPLVLWTTAITETFDISFSLCYAQYESQNIRMILRPIVMVSRHYRTH